MSGTARNGARGDGPVGDESRVIRLQRRAGHPRLESPERLTGSKPGQSAVRIVRPRERRFEQPEEGTLVATERAIAPRTGAERLWRAVRRVAVGKPISSAHSEEQRLSKAKALAVFSSDALSSSAYATDEILITLAAAGTVSFSYALPLAGAIVVLLAIVAISYRQTIRAYPGGGGAFIVARENLGQFAGLTAAAALATDYVLTVAVSIAAGVLAVVSAFPYLEPLQIELALAFIAFITIANLRGIKESGTIFAIPTYGFILSFGVLIASGLARAVTDPGLTAEVPESAYPAGSSALTAFLVLRAFASGCTALTGIEAISDGVPAFKRPEWKNAATTLVWMAAILATLFLGITVLARVFEVQPAEHISVAAQIGRTVFGESPPFYVIQAFTALILILAANTSYADFPRLASILARDRFLPHQFSFRGDKLAFSNGILVLGLASSALVVLFEADVTKLIPLYAFGVFVSFTLSQAGMVARWLRRREAGWRAGVVVNGFGAVTTGVVAVIVGATKFSHGAWISMAAMSVLALMFWGISRHYAQVSAALRLRGPALVLPGRQVRQTVLVPVEGLDLAVLKLIDYATSLTSSVIAIHVTDDMEAGKRLKAEWESTVVDVPLVVISSPYRSLVAPILSYLDAMDRSDGRQIVSVLLPEIRTGLPGTGWLHNQTARRLKKALLSRPGTAIIELPYDLSAEGPA
ncbi:MAG TPA: APC family permease [Dehalococcoidia bacterium]|nr:APC family permease [Dehalococcoidia bacterium]